MARVRSCRGDGCLQRVGPRICDGTPLALGCGFHGHSPQSKRVTTTCASQVNHHSADKQGETRFISIEAKIDVTKSDHCPHRRHRPLDSVPARKLFEMLLSPDSCAPGMPGSQPEDHDALCCRGRGQLSFVRECKGRGSSLQGHFLSYFESFTDPSDISKAEITVKKENVVFRK